MPKIEGGDSIKFGIKYCTVSGRKNLLNKTIKLTPQWFEEDNGLYCYESCCPGIWNEKEKEADSVYHLFGNDLEDLMDCKIIKGTEQDKKDYKKNIDDRNDEITKGYGDMADYFIKQQEEKQ